MRTDDGADGGRVSPVGRVRRRYRAWVDLGAGGLPLNPAGWLCSELLGLLGREPFSTSCYTGDGQAQSTLDLPPRRGPRPRTAPWPIPHRQVDQLADDYAQERLRQVFDSAVERNRGAVTYRQSFYERRHDAITLSRPGHAAAHIRRGRGELAHIHPSDGSIHMVLSEQTATIVLKAGWGQRHPLAGVPMKVPLTYLLIYPPRDSDELVAVERILAACIADAQGDAG